MSNRSVTAQITELLDDYQSDVQQITIETMDDVSKEAVKTLRDTSPKASGSYARGWTVKKDGQLSRVVYNKTDYQLTHLLENGHVIKNQFGTYGRAPAIKHIKPVEEWAQKEFPLRVSRGLS